MAKSHNQTGIGDLKRVREVRAEAARNAPMSERLARVHFLSKQMSVIKGIAAVR